MPRASEFDRRALAALLNKQHEVVTRQQALACRMSHDLVAYRARKGGPWQALVPGVYLTRSGEPTTVQREMAALLYAGPHSVLTGPAALRRHGLTTALRRQGPANGGGQVDVLVPVRMQRREAGFVRLHRTARLPKLICYDGEIRFVTPPRAVADTVRELRLSEARAVVANAVQRGRCTIDLLAEELAAGPVRESAQFRRVLAEVRSGVRSAAEADLRDLIKWAKLPEPDYNPRLFVGPVFLGSPDCWWPAAGVAVEVDSREWHLLPSDWENTLARHARMSAQGILVLHFTPRQVTTRRSVVAAQIRGALESRQSRPLPHIRALPAR